MRTPAADAAEHRVLTTEAGRELLAEVAWVRRLEPVDVARWRRSHPAEHVAAAIRLADSRRRGATKFAQADRMWFDPVGLEQATAESVARHKAARFAGGLVFDLCAGIGGDTLGMAGAGADVVAVDLDGGMNRRARWNAEVHGLGHRVAPVKARAEEITLPAGALVHVDPDRRAAGGGNGASPRARSIEDYAPSLPFLRGLATSGRGGAIKLGPAADFSGGFGDLPVEIELISLGGECKEATVWFGPLAGVCRRATCLTGGATWTDRDASDEPARPSAAVSPRAGSWAFDPDPTLGRAGLLDGFAAAHGLSRVAPGCDLLTGPNRVDSPFLAAFAVDESMPLDLKRLRRLVVDRNLGPLEIKTRGLDLTPEALRKALRPEGSTPATLLLVGGRGPSLALLARRG